MDYPRDWVITKAGKVVRRDKAKPNDVIPDDFVFEDNDVMRNTFPEKEDAYLCRDNIIDMHPAAFLEDAINKHKEEKKNMPRKKIITQDDFRETMRKECIERLPAFWVNWEKLTPKDKCDYFYKVLIFGFSKAPAEKPMTAADADAARVDRNRARAAEAIEQGIPEEYSDFDD